MLGKQLLSFVLDKLRNPPLLFQRSRVSNCVAFAIFDFLGCALQRGCDWISDQERRVWSPYMLVNPDFSLIQILKPPGSASTRSRAWRRDLKRRLIGIALFTDNAPQIRSSTRCAFPSPLASIQLNDGWCSCKAIMWTTVLVNKLGMNVASFGKMGAAVQLNMKQITL